MPRRISRAEAKPKNPLASTSGNKKLDKQLQRFRENEVREVPFPTPINPALAANGRQLMTEACDGYRPNLPRDSEDELLREQFLGQYFKGEMYDELSDIMADKPEREPWERWKRFKVRTDRL